MECEKGFSKAQAFLPPNMLKVYVYNTHNGVTTKGVCPWRHYFRVTLFFDNSHMGPPLLRLMPSFLNSPVNLDQRFFFGETF